MIINSDGFGLRGLNKGLTSTLGRHGVFNMIYFGFYFNVKNAIPASQVKIFFFKSTFGVVGVILRSSCGFVFNDAYRARTVIMVQTNVYVVDFYRF